MTDPVCTPAMHYFRTPLFDGEKCLCQQTAYNLFESYHHKPHNSDDDPKPFNPLMDTITSPWAPLILSGLMSGGGGFSGGASGGGGASGDW